MLVSVESGLPLMRSKGSSVGDGVLRWPNGDRGTGREVGQRGSSGTVGWGSDGLALAGTTVRDDGSMPASLSVPFSCGRFVTDVAALAFADVATLTCSSSCKVPRNVGIKYANSGYSALAAL